MGYDTAGRGRKSPRVTGAAAARGALRDRYELRALVAAAVEVVLFLAVIAYGLWPPSLQGKVALPTLAFLPAWAGLVGLTLHRPWEWGGVERGPWLGRIWGYWEGAVVYGGTLWVTWCHAHAFQEAKEWAAGLRALPDGWIEGLARAEDAQAWAADALGWLVLAGPLMGWVGVGVALFTVAVVWFLLTR